MAIAGYVNLNLIVNESGLGPREFTSRFGYLGFAICEALRDEPREDIFLRMSRRDSWHVATRQGFASGVVLIVPPFPYRHVHEEFSKGEPICLLPDTTAQDHAVLYFAEVAHVGRQLVTSGATGYVGVATGTDSSPTCVTVPILGSGSCVLTGTDCTPGAGWTAARALPCNRRRHPTAGIVHYLYAKSHSDQKLAVSNRLNKS